MTGSIYSNIQFENAYLELFHQYYPNLVYYATRLLGEDEAEDVVQDVFVELWKRKDCVEIGEYIQAFLYRAVYTRAINILKRRSVANGYSSAMEELDRMRANLYNPDDNDVIRRIENRELRLAIHNAISELPAKCQEVFKLSYLHHMKNKEIAEAIGVSLRTVEAHMYNALKTLRGKLAHLLPQ